MPLDYTYRIRIPHRSGQLERVTGAIASCEGLIGDIVTINMGREATIREITVEVGDEQEAGQLGEVLDALEGVTLLWARDRALHVHEGGKLRMRPAHAVETLQAIRDVYTPGVAHVSRAIAADPTLAARYTTIARSVAICTNGTRVLGLGDIGPLAAMPVMEGKALFYCQFAGISAVPILIDARDPDAFVETVTRIAPTFGGIHLEDISAPECFEIEARLREALPQPVMHDDVHGTAVVTLAAVIVGCHRAGLELDQAVVGQLGLGAAGLGISSLIVEGSGARAIASDPNEASHERARERGIEVVDQHTVMSESDVVVATTGQPGLIDPGEIRAGQVVFALTNPEPEILPRDAVAAGAAFAADGSMVNNLLGYPGLFRGALLAGARDINREMKVAAAHRIAELTDESELVPDPLDRRVHEEVADAVLEAAKSSGSARAERATSLS